MYVNASNLYVTADSNLSITAANLAWCLHYVFTVYFQSTYYVTGESYAYVVDVPEESVSGLAAETAAYGGCYYPASGTNPITTTNNWTVSFVCTYTYSETLMYAKYLNKTTTNTSAEATTTSSNPLNSVAFIYARKQIFTYPTA